MVIMPEYFYGGAEKQLRFLVKRLEEEGMLADVYVLHQNCNEKNKNTKLQIENEEMQFVSLIELDMYRYSSWEIKWAFYEYIYKNNLIDTYSVAILFYQWMLPLVPILKDCGIRVIYSERVDGSELCSKQEYIECAKMCDELTSNSVFAAQRIMKVLGREVIYINNAKEKQERLLPKNNKPIRKLLVPATIDSRKNQLLVLEFIANNSKNDYECHLIGKCGDKKYYKILSDYIADNMLDNVHILGYTDDIKSEYEWADLVILPSLSEGTPNVVLEAFSYGRPIIVSDILEEREFVRDSNLRFSTAISSEIGDCIKYIESMSGTEFLDKLSENYKYVLENYSVKKMTDCFLDIIQKLRANTISSGIGDYSTMFANDIANMGRELRKKEDFYNLLCKWVQMHQESKSIKNYFNTHGYKRVAIYGFKELGQLLYKELIKQEIIVSAVIDRNTDVLSSKVTMIKPDSFNDNKTDVIIVTAISSYEEIKKDMERLTKLPIVSLDSIIDEGV